ncbi:MAG: fibronectin type III-like domain-contianing protein [Chloracidobacterium sp.]|nr:fibronectin type III-like domain-contianing protein [Chloracidobacterium sp.]
MLSKVSVEVENTGKVDGDEVVQLYISDVAASVTRPIKELKGLADQQRPGRNRSSSSRSERKSLNSWAATSNRCSNRANLSFMSERAAKICRRHFLLWQSYQQSLQSRRVTTNRSARLRLLDPDRTGQQGRRRVSRRPAEADVSVFWDHSDPKTGLTLTEREPTARRC